MLPLCEVCKCELAIRESVVQQNTLETYCRNCICVRYTYTKESYPFANYRDMERTFRLLHQQEISR